MQQFDFDYEGHRFSSPGYMRCTLPEQVKKEVQSTIEKIDRGEIKTDDHRSVLAGHLQKETTFPITENLNYLVKTMCREFDNVFYFKNSVQFYHPDYINECLAKGYVFDYVLRDLWINYGKKYDFNPVHKHAGCYSFVLWVKIPYKSEDEAKEYPLVRNGGLSGKFKFLFQRANVPGFIGNEVVDAVEWDLILFPAVLNHTVYPFYTSDEERISISGNLFYEPVKKEIKWLN